jgi:ATP-dependent Lon protease
LKIIIWKLRNVETAVYEIEEGAKGISYRNLFLSFLQDCSEIKLIDPYIRLPHQVQNFKDFCEILYEIKTPKISLTLVTSHELNRQPESKKLLEELKKTFSMNNKIEFNYTLKSDKELHSRKIIIDNKRKIILDRGLDIFLKQDFGNETNDSRSQEKRQCKSFYLVFLSK